MYEKVSSSLNNVAVTLYENNDKIQSKHFWATTLHIIKIDTLFFYELCSTMDRWRQIFLGDATLLHLHFGGLFPPWHSPPLLASLTSVPFMVKQLHTQPTCIVQVWTQPFTLHFLMFKLNNASSDLLSKTEVNLILVGLLGDQIQATAVCLEAKAEYTQSIRRQAPGNQSLQ